MAPDGKQVAYAERHCAAGTACAYSIVIQDLGSGEKRNIIDGLRRDPPLMTWSPDQRFLLVSGLIGAKDRDYLISTLGGRVRDLGCCGAEFFGNADTLIQPQAENDLRDTASRPRWFRLLATDGRWLDSIRVDMPGGSPWPRLSPDGRKLLIWNYIDDADQHFYLATRDGRLTDSIPFLPGMHGMLVRWTDSGDDVLALVREGGGSGVLMSLVRVRVDEQGRVHLPADTLATGLRLPLLGRLAPPGRAGTIALQAGPAVPSTRADTDPARHRAAIDGPETPLHQAGRCDGSPPMAVGL